MASIQAQTTAKPLNLALGQLSYLAAGLYFGVVLVKAEVISWFRIQEMFRFQSFHMYAVIASAVGVAALSLWLLRKFKLKSMDGQDLFLKPKAPGYFRYITGGILFGLGWALTGACPGPIAALIGTGSSVFLVVLLSAMAGTWIYGVLRPHLPH